jgi:NADH-quinone oxidoreductase subunit G
MNEWNYVSLCGAGRYAFDYENTVESKDEVAFKSAVEAFNKAESIEFTSTITNEEALILQNIKEKTGVKLVNKDAYAFQTFLNNYSEISGTKLYANDLKATHNSNFVVSIGAALKSDNPNARYALNNSMTVNKGAGLYFHPLKDPIIEGLGKSIMTVPHAPLQEEVALYLVLDLFGDKEKIPSDIKDYLESFHSEKTVTVTETIKEEVVEMAIETKVNEETGEEESVEVEKKKMVPKKVEKEVVVQENRLLDILGADSSFMEDLEKNLKKKDTFALIAGPDLYQHPNSKNCARLLGLIEKFTDFEITMIPTLTNTLGVSLICELDDKSTGYTVGYNVKGDFTLSALGDGDLDMPAINQQEGTLTSINKRVNPTNAALAYHGYELNDIADALGIKAQLTIDYTAKLPKEAGFKEINFDDLPNHYDNDGVEHRGYSLENIKTKKSTNQKVEPFSEDKLEGTIAYLANPIRQFSGFTNKATNVDEVSGVYMSADYLSASDFNEGDSVRVKTDNGELIANIVSDNKISGEIVVLPTFDSNLNSEALFSGYRFSLASIEKV